MRVAGPGAKFPRARSVRTLFLIGIRLVMSPLELPTTATPARASGSDGVATVVADGSPSSLRIGPHIPHSPYFLAPLAGYTHLAFRNVVRANGGVGWATTDLVQASHLVAGTRWARELVRTDSRDTPLSVQIYGGVVEHLVAAAKWLQDHGYAAVDINMGCPMAKITGQGGGARLMCRVDGACDLVRSVVEAVSLPVTVKMRLGWDRERITAPTLAREFEQIGVAAITIHGRTRSQGFRGTVDREGIRAVVEGVQRIPVVGNGDVKTVADAWRMRDETGCAAVAIGRGALLDPWLFKRLERAEPYRREGRPLSEIPPWEPDAVAELSFLREHFSGMVAQHGEFQSCLQFRKFAAWYGARLGMPEDLEDRFRRFTSVAEFDAMACELEARRGERLNPRPTTEIRVPNGPVEYW
jgi:tRNA-dihydrouridine synthase B